MGGFSNAPRCPAFLTFRDSPALVRQESDGYPVRPAACYSDADRPSRLPFPNPDEPMIKPLPARPEPLPPLPPPPHTHTRTHRRRASAAQRHTCSKEKKKGNEETSGGDSPPMQAPERGRHRRSCA